MDTLQVHVYGEGNGHRASSSKYRYRVHCLDKRLVHDVLGWWKVVVDYATIDQIRIQEPE